ncbi:MAG: AI-2E family transporter [Gammaproteobacteria bacterium]|nr:AI-2E family transporter [Gammaproteobacteria bacterium]
MSDSQRWFTLTIIVGTGVLLYLLAPIFTPFLLGALLAYMFDPLVRRLETRRFSRTLATVLVFVLLLVLFTLLLLVLVPVIERQITVLITKLPVYIDWVQRTLLPLLYERFDLAITGFDSNTLYQALAGQWREAGGIAANVLKSMSNSGAAVLGFLLNLLLIPLVTFYLLRDWPQLLEQVRNLLPRKSEQTIMRLAAQSDEVLGGFLRGQLLVMLSLALLYTVGLWLIGLDLALLIGVLAGLLSFIPYLGVITGVLAAGIATVVQYHDWLHLVPVLIVFGIGQLAEGFFLTPRLVGDRIGLHPIAVIFAIMAGGQLFGFSGVLLALPAAAVLMVLLRYAHERYVNSYLYDRSPDEP